ncbi:hypothetical protein D3C72_2142890 [compost metagenome]
MRVRPHVDARPDVEIGRAHLVQEDEGTDAAALRGRNGAAHGKAAQVAGARHHDGFDLVFASLGQGGHVGVLRIGEAKAICEAKAILRLDGRGK